MAKPNYSKPSDYALNTPATTPVLNNRMSPSETWIDDFNDYLDKGTGTGLEGDYIKNGTVKSIHLQPKAGVVQGTGANITSLPGVGVPGLTEILSLTVDLSSFSNPKVRLDGHARFSNTTGVSQKF